MKIHPADDSLQELVELKLRRLDLRYTSGRRAIVELLARSRDPISISDIATQLPSIPRSSAYRHLADLQVAGVVRRLSANDEFSLYELAEELTEHHHHLLCISCGKVFDVTPSSGLERTVDAAVVELSAQLGFQPVAHAIDIMGHCVDCVGTQTRPQS
jgi:Fur family transcriptional regulator, ferric uptake regulator